MITADRRGVMKVLHLCLIGPFTDGWNYQENLLTKYHARMGMETVVLCSRWQWGKDGKLVLADCDDFVNADHVHICRLAIKGKDQFRRVFKRYRGLYEAMEEENPDYLFIHGVAFLDTKVIARYLRNHPHVIAYADNHSDFTNTAMTWASKNILHKIIWRHYSRLLLPYVKKFFGVLPARVDFLMDMYGFPKEKCDLLVMGADDDFVEESRDPALIAQVRSTYHIGKDDFLIVTGGKIDRYKAQVLNLLAAVGKWNQTHQKRVRLLVFGSIDEELKPKVLDYCDGKDIQYIGWQENRSTYHLIACADLAVYPGRHSVLWEQTAGQGIPLVVKDWPGTHHVDVDGNVIFLKQDNAEEIEQVLDSLLNHAEIYQTMRDKAQASAHLFLYSSIARKALGMEKA